MRLSPTTWTTPARDRLAVLLLGALLFLPGLSLRDVWNPDEARYAQVAREMSQRGSWSVPYLNGELYMQKPPLFFWAIALSGAATGGVSELDARLPSALAAIGAVFLVFLLGERFFGRRGAWLSAAVFATCFKVLWQGRFGQIDMLLTFWVTLAMWFWVSSWLDERPRLVWGFWAATGLATLTKGPVGLLPPLLAIVAFLLLSGRRAELRRLRAGWGLLLWAAVVLAWLVPAGIAAGGGYVETLVFEQNVTRYADPWHHVQPWYYYLTVIPAELVPWSFFLPAALVVAAARLREAGPRQWRRPPDLERTGLLFALSWVAVTVVFFSLSAGKRSVYVLTCYPALALWVGGALDHVAAAWPSWRRWVTVPFLLLVALLSTATVTVLGQGSQVAELAVLGEGFFWVAFGAVAVLTLSALWGLQEGRRGRIVRAVAGLAAGMAVLELALSLYLLPAANVFKSARGLSEVLAQRMAPGEEYGVFRRRDAGFAFYTGRSYEPLETVEALQRFATRPERVWILAERDELAKVENLPPLWELARDADERDGYLLLTNRPSQ